MNYLNGVATGDRNSVLRVLSRRGGRVVEGGGLLNRYTGNTVSEVRILSSPPDYFGLILLLEDSLAFS